MSEVQDILNRYPQARIQVFVLWAPFMQQDSRATAQRAAAFLADSRARHFWDLWRFGTRTYAQQLPIPAQDAWDMLTFYQPRLSWREEIPPPTFWMQNRFLKVGTPYSKQALEEELRKWF